MSVQRKKNVKRIRGSNTNTSFKIYSPEGEMGNYKYESISTITYLFCGISLFFVFVALSIVVICSYMRLETRDSTARGDPNTKEKPEQHAVTVVDDIPSIVVIMASDRNPTLLATPAPVLPDFEQV